MDFVYAESSSSSIKSGQSVKKKNFKTFKNITQTLPLYNNILSNVATNTNSTKVTITSACNLHFSLSVSLIPGTGYQATLILVHYHASSEVSSV